ncbi:PKS-NRPS hybrid synthetase [Dictyocoela muelleri]|nr:PKS-NRPS hybrid synthetase [Dictyocoela muelleri]
MPHVASLRDYICRERNKLFDYTPGIHPDIPESIKRDKRGNIFMRFRSGYSDTNRFIIFMSEYKMKFIQSIDTFVIDGTFRSAPQGFHQLLVIHGCLFGKTYPFLFILMTNKTEESYKNVFNKTKELFCINPKLIKTDFDKALINATSDYFPNISSHGCLFHLGQAIWARIGSLGLINRYKTDINLKKAIKILLCLSFMPVKDLLIGYGYIKQLIVD